MRNYMKGELRIGGRSGKKLNLNHRAFPNPGKDGGKGRPGGKIQEGKKKKRGGVIRIAF